MSETETIDAPEQEPATQEPAAQPSEPTQPASWRDSLPEDIRDSPSLKDFKGPEDLAKSYLAVQPLIGADKIVKPGKDATPEQIDAYYKKLGRPDQPDGYKLPEQLPEGITPEGLDEGKVDHMRKVAHANGLTDQQFADLARGMLEYEAGFIKQSEQARSESAQQNVAKLHQEWGTAFDQNVELADNGASFAHPELVDVLKQAGINTHPVVMEAMRKIGKTMAQDSISGDGPRRGFADTPQEALAKLAAFDADPVKSQAYRKGDKALIEERFRLSQAAFPDNEDSGIVL